ncbi:hypothetical protein CTI12_AA181110 [Artemisia annua]|uniref:Uncharacterized protein n=1 Tax=Artemisia annua TaxID=35608 RepID=A0A2U1P7W3_ARTAN|nr:hypothetical protein CTI12_AA181110 [Artemisia annua]
MKQKKSTEAALKKVLRIMNSTDNVLLNIGKARALKCLDDDAYEWPDASRVHCSAETSFLCFPTSKYIHFLMKNKAEVLLLGLSLKRTSKLKLDRSIIGSGVTSSMLNPQHRRHVTYFWRNQADAFDVHTLPLNEVVFILCITYQMKDGTNYIIRAAGVKDYQSVIDLHMEWKKTPSHERKSLVEALVDGCSRNDYHCLVAVDKLKEEVLYGTIGVRLGMNVPEELGWSPVEQKILLFLFAMKWHSGSKADAYVDFLVVASWARRNGVGTNLFACAKQLAIQGDDAYLRWSGTTIQIYGLLVIVFCVAMFLDSLGHNFTFLNVNWHCL